MLKDMKQEEGMQTFKADKEQWEMKRIKVV